MDKSAPQTFLEMKEKVINMINIRSKYFVDSTTNIKESGIYLLYVDKFDSNSILPIYIGRSKNIQRRFKQHKKDILALNRFGSIEYSKYFFLNTAPFYEGKYKAPKIFKYMVDNNCDIKDLKMIVLEFTNEYDLEKTERKYIMEYLSPFLGFNQLLSITDRLGRQEQTVEEEKDIKLWEFYNLKFFKDFGYSKFNFLKAYSPKIEDKFILEIEKDYNNFHEVIKINTKPLLDKKLKIENALSKVEQRRNKLLEEVFFKIKESDFAKDPLLFSKFKKAISEEDLTSKEYLKTYLLNQQIDYNYEEIFAFKLKILKNLNEQLLKLKEEYNSIYLEKKKYDKHGLVFPSKNYLPFPLKDEKIIKNKSIKNNELQVFFDMSNSGKTGDGFFYYAQTLKVTARYKSESKEHIEKFYIQNNLSTCDYFEGSFYRDVQLFLGSLRKQPFSPFKGDIHERNWITTEAELKTGINDYTLINKDKVSLIDALNNIYSKFYRKDIKIKIFPSESKKCFTESLTIDEKNHLLLKGYIS